MLTIQNQYKIIAEGFTTTKHGTNEYWVVDDMAENEYSYDIRIIRKISIFEDEVKVIRILRELNETGCYLVMIFKDNKIIDRDNIRAKNIQTADMMLMQLSIVLELM